MVYSSARVILESHIFSFISTHKYCLPCIVAWSKINNVCPTCRSGFNHIIEQTSGAEIYVPDKLPDDSAGAEPECYCQECGESTDEATLLLCDGCDLGYHLACLRPRLTAVPDDDWYCLDVLHLSTYKRYVFKYCDCIKQVLPIVCRGSEGHGRGRSMATSTWQR